ncbi:hypothetical protein BJ878DRAFT_337416 [Calycina marina]|uniref:2EXR domain-containing protein n=1 Tax=Calycina marina TaxID=1763456 RepID=A0A9P8CC62_9HELO|nr:hypothetical protein BJ878DRAFT_337416 [Calycina marina]
MEFSDHWMVVPEEAPAFPRFGQLPTELRLQIWREALPGPRTIHLVKYVTQAGRSSPSSPCEIVFYPDFGIANRMPFSSYYDPQDEQSPKKSPRQDLVHHCMSTVKCPIAVTSMLHTCQESRREVQTRYKPIFTPKSPNDSTFRIHYFDPLVDGVFIDDIWPWVQSVNCRTAAVFKTRKLSISCNAWFFEWAIDSPILRGQNGLLRFKNLEELQIVWRIMSDEEEKLVNEYYLGHLMGPEALTKYLRRPSAPYDIAFPAISVDVDAKEILNQFSKMHEEHPDWSIPKIKLVKWASRPKMASRPNTSSKHRGH